MHAFSSSHLIYLELPIPLPLLLGSGVLLHAITRFDEIKTAGSRMLVAFIAALVSQPAADYDMPCDTCVGDFSGRPESATKVWCPLAGCVTGNTVAARPLCGDETIVYLKAHCRARNTRPASCRVTGPLKKQCSCPEGKGQAQCKSLLSKRLATVEFEEPMGRLAAETYTQGEVSGPACAYRGRECRAGWWR